LHDALPILLPSHRPATMLHRTRATLALSVLVILTARPELARAHASEGAFVLLLPTGHYMAAGIAAVAATLLLLAFPAIGAAAARLAEPVMLGPWRPGRLARWTSAGSFLLLAFVLHAGLIGPTDPLANPVGPFIWVFWWIVLLLVQALVGDVWHWIDPWRAPVTLARRAGLRPVLTLPA